MERVYGSDIGSTAVDPLPPEDTMAETAPADTASPVTVLDVADQTGVWFDGSRGQDDVDRAVIRLALVAGLTLDDADRCAFEAWSTGTGVRDWANWLGTDTLGEYVTETLVDVAADYLNTRVPDGVAFTFDGGDFRLDRVPTEPDPRMVDPWADPNTPAYEPPF